MVVGEGYYRRANREEKRGARCSLKRGKLETKRFSFRIRYSGFAQGGRKRKVGKLMRKSKMEFCLTSVKKKEEFYCNKAFKQRVATETITGRG